ncbi:MAG: hypothetical protein JNK87_09020 [Bryobacterales bacterium]|nr:hypothetical protein [Bryobacterales bacterium]
MIESASVIGTVIRPDMRVRGLLLAMQVCANALVAIPAAMLLWRTGRQGEASVGVLFLLVTTVLAVRWGLAERRWSISARGIVGFGLGKRSVPLEEVEAVEYANHRGRYGRAAHFRLRTKRGTCRVLFARVSPAMGLFQGLREIFPEHLFRFTRATDARLRARVRLRDVVPAVAMVLVVGLQLSLLPVYAGVLQAGFPALAPEVGIWALLVALCCAPGVLDYRQMLVQVALAAVAIMAAGAQEMKLMLEIASALKLPLGVIVVLICYLLAIRWLVQKRG